MSLESLPTPRGVYSLEECLSSGAYGKVYFGKDDSSGRRVAIKVRTLNGNSNKYVEEEYKILKEFSDHPNLPDFYGAYCTKGDIWFVMELFDGGTVRNMVDGLLAKNRHMREEHIAHILKETVKALAYLHKNHVVHRNVRGSSLLLTKDGDIKVCDFGISRCLDSTLDRTGSCIGSPCWMAPEVVLGRPGKEDRQYDNRADVWALGITAIELADGRAPYEDTYPTRALFQIVRNPPPTLRMQSLWSNNYNDFVNECLVKNPEHRPFMEEVIEHPFLADIPENSYHLSLELKAILADLENEGARSDSVEVTVNGQYLKRGAEAESERMYVEDLASLGDINEGTVLHELQARMEKGEFQTFIGDILLVLNPNEKRDVYSFAHRQKYSSKSRSENAPHVYAVADAAYQAALHHQVAQKVLLAGEAGSGKTANFLHLIDQLLHLGDNANINTGRIRRGLHLVHALTHASTPHNPYSTRCILKASLAFGRTGKVTGAEFGVYFLEKWRVSSVDMSQSNYHMFYYLYDGLNAEGLLEKYSLESHRNYRYLRIPKDKSSRQPRNNIDKNVTKFHKLKETMEEFEFSKEQVETVYKIMAAILILGDVRFKETDDELAEVENTNNVTLAADLLGLGERRLGWSLCNYCLLHDGAVVKRRLSTDEARDARDVLANNLYTRVVDFVVGIVNDKLAVGRAIFGESYLISILDYFGFECFDRNELPQLLVNCFNEQMHHHYLQRVFAWEEAEAAEDGVATVPTRYVDNRATLDQLLGKADGVLSYIDEASRMAVGGKYVTDFLETKARQYVTSEGPMEFSVAHYTGKVTYNVKEMPDRNRDYLPPEVIETLRLSNNDIIKHLFTTKLNRAGNAIIKTPDSDEDKPKTVPAGNFKESNEYSQISRMRTSIAVFKAISLGLLKEVSAGAGYGGVHHVRCLRTRLDGSPGPLHADLVRQQLRALAVVETVRLRRGGYPHRVLFPEFLRRYKFLAFDFDENVEVTKENCRLLLIRLKMEGWAIGQSKVFLKYYNEEYLARLYEIQVKKIVKIQSIMRGFLTKCRMKRKGLETQRRQSERLTRRRQSSLTQVEAAIIIQQAYRKSTKRRQSIHLDQDFMPLDEGQIEFITPFARKWRRKTFFQVLLQYRSYCYQQFYNFALQVHFCNQEFFFDMERISKMNVHLNSVDESATVDSWLGEKKPTVLKMPFRFDEIPYYDTSAMICDPLMNLGASIDEIEPWDSPYRYREMVKTRSLSMESDSITHVSPYKKRKDEELINIPYSRDPEKPVATLSAIEDEDGREDDDTTVDSDEGVSRDHYTYTNRSKAFKETENKAMKAKGKENIYKKSPYRPPNKTSTIMNSNTKPANKDFEFIKPQVVNKPRVDPVAELREIVRKSSLTGEDDPPFNFQGMLRKTNFKRDSLKKAAEDIRSLKKSEPSKLAREDNVPKVVLRSPGNTSYDNRGTPKVVLRNTPKTQDYNGYSYNYDDSRFSKGGYEGIKGKHGRNQHFEIKGTRIETELLPGFFISGIEVEL